MFKEINDYSEKFYGLTFRQWIFAALAVAVVVPTYILLPKYAGISEDIASYIVIIEAAIIGFIGFVKINEQPAEALIPYLYRHFTVFGKPIKYMTDKEYAEAHEKKNKKKDKAKKAKTDDINQLETSAEKIIEKTAEEKSVDMVEKAREEETSDVPVNNESALSKKEQKKKEKQEKMLEKAKKKYSYILQEDKSAGVNTNTAQKSVSLTEEISVEEPEKETSEANKDESSDVNVPQEQSSDEQDATKLLTTEDIIKLKEMLINGEKKTD